MFSQGERLSLKGQFVWGAIGAGFPPLIKAWEETKPADPILPRGWKFILLTALILIAGGLWSRAMESHKEWKAIYNGATFPLVFGFLAHLAR
jgi:hypothetical protein